MNKIITILLVFVSCLAFGQGATPNLRSGLFGYWKFEETSGTTIFDERSDSYDLTNTSAIVNQTGKVGLCYDFELSNSATAVSSYVAAKRPLYGEYSFSLWVKPESTGEDRTIIGSWEEDGFMCIMRMDFSEWFSLLIQDDGSTTVGGTFTGLPSIATATWFHIVIVADGSFLRMYVDGSEATNSFSYDGTLNATVSTDTKVRIGSRFSTGSGIYDEFDGLIDELKYFNRGLKEIEVKQDYNSGDGLLYVYENFKNGKISFHEYLAYYLNYINYNS